VERNIKKNPLEGLKICFISGTLGVGGAERQLFYIIRATKSLGADVSLICLNNGEFWEKPIKETGIAYYTLRGKGNKITRILKISGILRKIKPDIVYSQHFYTNLYAYAGALFVGAVSVGSSRNELKEEIKHNGIFGKPAFCFPDYFVANSILSIDQAEDMRRSKKSIFYLPNALDSLIFAPGDESVNVKKNKYTFLTIGRLEPQKRTEKFVSLIAGLKERYGNKIKGVIVGSGSLEIQLKEFASTLGLTDEILEFVPFTKNPDLYMKSADVFIMTSDYEGTPNVILEAMATGLPVITTNVGNLPNIITDKVNGFIFNGEPEQLINISDELIANDYLRENISGNARKTIEDQFSISALETNLKKIYLTISNQSIN
jgi:glycosyltransferase involved in cell wall biosynthesis